MASDWNDTRQLSVSALIDGKHGGFSCACVAWPNFCRRSIFSILIGGDRSRGASCDRPGHSAEGQWRVTSQLNFHPIFLMGWICSLVKQAQFYISPTERLHFHTLQADWSTKSTTLQRFGSLTISLRFADLWQRVFSAWRSDDKILSCNNYCLCS